MDSSVTDNGTGIVTLIFSAATSIAASVFFLRQFVPSIVEYHFFSFFNGLLSRLFSSSNELTVVVHESDGFSPNHMYKAAELYLASAVVPNATTPRRLCVNVPYDDDDQNVAGDLDRAEVRYDAMQIMIDKGEEIVDVYKGVKFLWRLVCRERNRQSGSPNMSGYESDQGSSTDMKSYELSFNKRYKDLAIKSYLPHVLEQAKAIRNEVKTLKLYTSSSESSIWMPVKLRHPATFDSLAMDDERKKALINDLLRFVQRKEYYKRIGRAWKRGYLLYGPPGTGKSTLIAAIANFLKYDIYDLELTGVMSNGMLRSLLMSTTSRSILVIEDIDCSLELQNRDKEKPIDDTEDGPFYGDRSKVTLSGLLNFVDGLWSSCGDERIIIFTTNHKDKLDPALLRPGRMDMHIYMGYCDSAGFRILASNYHGLKEHPLFTEIDSLIETVEISPAEVAEALMRSDNVEIALDGLIKLLTDKRIEAEEAKNKEKDLPDSGEPDYQQEIGD